MEKSGEYYENKFYVMKKMVLSQDSLQILIKINVSEFELKYKNSYFYHFPNATFRF
jgi:hypothetical protein